MKIKVQVENGRHAGERVRLIAAGRFNAFRIGRSATCEIVLPEEEIGRVHTRLLVHDDEVFLEDMGSPAGTHVADVGEVHRYSLVGTTRVRIGRVWMTIEPVPDRATDGPALSDPALVEAIRQNPDADEPRLVYADWLTQHGDPRGEFIAIQCKLARARRAGGDFSELQNQQDSLLDVYEDHWVRLLVDATAWTFTRGFLEQVRMPARSFVAVAPELFRTEPALERIDLRRGDDSTAGELVELSLCPELRTIRHLSLGDYNATAAVFASLVSSTHLTALETLHARVYGRAPHAARRCVAAVTRNPSLQSLRRLVLSGCGVNDEMAADLAACSHLQQLEVLVLEHGRLTDSGAETLLGLASLQQLHLPRNEVSPVMQSHIHQVLAHRRSGRFAPA